MVASLLVPRSMGRLHAKKELLVGPVPSARSAQRKQACDHRGSTQSPGHRLLHFARPDLLPGPWPRLFRPAESNGLASAANQTLGRVGLQSDSPAPIATRVEDFLRNNTRFCHPSSRALDLHRIHFAFREVGASISP